MTDDQLLDLINEFKDREESNPHNLYIKLFKLYTNRFKKKIKSKEWYKLQDELNGDLTWPLERHYGQQLTRALVYDLLD